MFYTGFIGIPSSRFSSITTLCLNFSLTHLVDTVRVAGLYSYLVASPTSFLGLITSIRIPAVVLFLFIIMHAVVFILGCICEWRARRHVKNIS